MKWLRQSRLLANSLFWSWTAVLKGTHSEPSYERMRYIGTQEFRGMREAATQSLILRPR
jgi:hypothetical protein